MVFLVAIRTFVFFLAFIASKTICGKLPKANIWLLCERPLEARDNAYHLFKYIRQNHPNQNVYYVIDKDAPDAKKVLPYGNVINYGSWKHYLYFASCSIVASSHTFGITPLGKQLRRVTRFIMLNILKHQKFCYLKHGIIKDTPENLLKRYTPDFKLFVCATRREYEFVSQYLDHPKEAFKLLGLARFDALMDTEPLDQILFMPTFRYWLTDRNGFLSMQQRQEKFLLDDYYKCLQSLINNAELDSALEKQGLKFVFYPHFNAQEFLHLFSTKSKNIIIASKGKYDVQQLMKDSKMMITDFSSVAFDFAYMSRPMAYYQFDVNKFREKHYATGYFDYEADGFGPVIKSEKDLVDYICLTMDRCCMIEDVYKARIDGFFTFRDAQNCKRNYEAIKELQVNG